MNTKRIHESVSIGRRVALLILLGAFARPAVADRLFVSSPGGAGIVEIDQVTGSVRPFYSGSLSPESGACSPTGDYLYFPETHARRLTRWSVATGLPENVMPTAGVVSSVIGPSFDRAGNLYSNTAGNPSGHDGAWFLADGDPSGAFTQIVPRFGSFGFGSNIIYGGPHAGALLLVDAVEQRVIISEPPGAPARDLIPQSSFPWLVLPLAIVTDGCGDIFVLVSEQGGPARSAIYHYDAEGSALPDRLPMSGSPITFAQYMEIDSVGDLYVPSSNTGIVWKVTADGTASPLAVVPSAVGVAICRDRFIPPCPPDPPICALAASLTIPCPSDFAAPGVQLDASGSHAANGGPVTFSWSTDCPFGVFDDEHAGRPRLIVPDAPCDLACTTTVEIVSMTGLTSSCETAITVQDNIAPLLAAPADLTVECPAPSSGSGSEAEWLARATATDDCGTARAEHALVRTDLGCGESFTRVHDFWAVDGCGNESPHEQRLYQVVDTTPPTFARSGHQFETSLWPPNHGYVVFEVLDLVSATDACGTVTVSVTGCASNQPEDAPESRSAHDGNGDGHTTQDCVLSQDGTRFAVRAERMGSCGADSARTYTIELTATDECGNSAMSHGVVTIDHDGRADGTDAGRSLRPNEALPFPVSHPTTYARGCP